MKNIHIALVLSVLALMILVVTQNGTMFSAFQSSSTRIPLLCTNYDDCSNGFIQAGYSEGEINQLDLRCEGSSCTIGGVTSIGGVKFYE